MIYFNLDSLFSQLPQFSRDITLFLKRLEITEQCRNFILDHVALQASSEGSGYRLFTELEKKSLGNHPLATAQVNGRQISIFELQKPVQVLQQDVFIIELLFPKPSQQFSEDHWAHLEFILPQISSTDTLAETVTTHFGKDKIASIKTKCTYKESTPKIEGLPESVNSTISFIDENLSVKFHLISLKEAVEQENRILKETP